MSQTITTRKLTTKELKAVIRALAVYLTQVSCAPLGFEEWICDWTRMFKGHDTQTLVRENQDGTITVNVRHFLSHFSDGMNLYEWFRVKSLPAGGMIVSDDGLISDEEWAEWAASCS